MSVYKVPSNPFLRSKELKNLPKGEGEAFHIFQVPVSALLYPCDAGAIIESGENDSNRGTRGIINMSIIHHSLQGRF